MPVYLVAAYGVFWGLTFVLVISIWARQRRLERAIDVLEAQLERTSEEEPGLTPTAEGATGGTPSSPSGREGGE